MVVTFLHICLTFLILLSQSRIRVRNQMMEPGEGYEEPSQGENGYPIMQPGAGSYNYQYNNVRAPARQTFWWKTNNWRYPSQMSRNNFQYSNRYFWWKQQQQQQQQPGVQTNPPPPSGGFGLHYRHIVKLINDHNTVRSRLRAANVYKMKWSNQLASEAFAWIQHCQMEHQRRGRGENLAMVYGHGANLDMLVNSAIDGWYREKYMWRYGDGFSSSTGHYTQMIWYSSKAMGCAAKQCPDKLLLACFYSPQGNIMGQVPYRVGPPCSQCYPNNMCQANLCLW